MSPQDEPHARVETELALVLRDCLAAAGSSLQVMAGTDVEIADRELLQPDVTIYAPRNAEKGLPAAHVRLIVELAPSTEGVDLGRKRLRYAAAGVPEYRVMLLGRARVARFAAFADGDHRRRDGFALAEGSPWRRGRCRAERRRG